MALFHMYQSTPVGGDCTCAYRVRLNAQCTVRELIEDIMRERPNEWGFIEVKRYKAFNNKYDRVISFKNGEYDTSNISEVLDEIVESVSASGGWSNMDWNINIK